MYLTDNPQEVEILRRHRLDSVEGAFAFAQGQDLWKPGIGGRRRTRLQLTDEAGRPVEWYLKRYVTVPARHLRGLLARRGQGPAGRECANIRLVESIGVPTMRVLAMGDEGGRGYLVVTAVPGEALERRFSEFFAQCGDDQINAFNGALTKLIVRLHGAGLVHRDLYAAHVFMDSRAGGVKLYLIDLARVFRPRWRKFRWRVKDLAALKYSMPAAWVQSHWETFFVEYCAIMGLSSEIQRYRRAVERKVARLLHRQQRKLRRP